MALVMGVPVAAQVVPVTIETEMGNIELEIDTISAPVTGQNFLRYVDAALYNGGFFHRAVKTRPDNQPQSEIKIDVIQGTMNPDKTKKAFKPIPLERTRDTGLRHKDGTISMARAEPDTATYDFFICIGNQPSLDFGGMRNPDGQGFAAFGRVVRGMELVRDIQQSKADGQKLTPPIKIIRVSRDK